MDLTCKRCGATAKEPLTFSSRYKHTTVHLCLECFEAARKVFEEFMRGDKKDEINR